MMFWYGGHWGFWQAGLMWLVMLAFLGLLVWAGYTLMAAATRRQPGNGGGPSAREILDRRLARGEIDESEYRRLRELMDRADSVAGRTG